MDLYIYLTWFLICFFFCSFSNQGSAFDFGELEEAIVLQGIKIRNDEAKARMLPFPWFYSFSDVR